MFIENGGGIFDEFLNLTGNFVIRRIRNARNWIVNLFKEISMEVSRYSTTNFEPKTHLCSSVMMIVRSKYEILLEDSLVDIHHYYGIKSSSEVEKGYLMNF
jgi:hypothetical protein